MVNNNARPCQCNKRQEEQTDGQTNRSRPSASLLMNSILSAQFGQNETFMESLNEKGDTQYKKIYK